MSQKITSTVPDQLVEASAECAHEWESHHAGPGCGLFCVHCGYDPDEEDPEMIERRERARYGTSD